MRRIALPFVCLASLGLVLSACTDDEGVVEPPSDTSSAGGETGSERSAAGTSDDLRLVDAPLASVVGQPFVLDGTRSQDDGAVQTFTWRQVDGPTVALGNASSPTPTFVPLSPGTYVFELTVTDTSGASRSTGRVEVVAFAVGNDPPLVEVTSPNGGMVGEAVSVSYVLSDSTADLVSVQLFFSVDGGTTFAQATPAEEAARESDTGLSTSSEGAVHVFAWDAQADLGTDAAIDVVLQLQAFDAELGQAATTQRFAYHPLLSLVQQGCEISPETWDVSVRGWDPVKKELVACQDSLLSSLTSSLDAVTAVRLPTGELLLDSTPVDMAAPSLISSLRLLQTAADSVDEVSTGSTLALAGQLNDSLAALELTVATLEAALTSLGGDAQLANIDLQNQLQKQQQTLQTMSNVSKMLHDTAMAIIRKIG